MTFLHVLGFLAEAALVLFAMVGALHSGGWWIAALVAYAACGMLLGTRWITVLIVALVLALVIS
ncbi:MAG: hypothetical protein A3H34_07415 [Betaproteobacteria bacterium RIFCSPLOWO2_02_FULL_67_19]|nr:MAG: hypothetical protein A3H34_07415 [Betaproteobacteria bacterium RIFCSPLOWO2_02_FULL_67_19]